MKRPDDIKFMNSRRAGTLFQCRGLKLLVRCLMFLIVLMVPAILLSPVFAAATLVDRIVAVVNDDPILMSDLDEAMSPWQRKLAQEGYSDAQQRLMLADKRPQMLEQLINEKLTEQQIRRHRITIADPEVDATIQRIREVNQLTEGALRHMLEMDGLTFEAYRKQIKEQLLRQKLVNKEVKSKIVITEKEIQAYYDQHSERYAGRTKVHLRHLLLKVDANASDEQRKRVLQLMQQIHRRLEAGESFEQLARVYSESSSAERGGYLGEFEERLLSKVVKDAIKGLKKGDFTQIINTEHGYQVFYMEDVIQSGGKSFEEAKAEIEDKLYAEVVDKKFREWLKQLREQAHIEILK